MHLKSNLILLLGLSSTLIFMYCTEDHSLIDEDSTASMVLDERARQKYIITLHEGEDLSSLEDIRGIGKGILKKIKADQDPEHIYAHSIKGFTAYLSQGQLKKLANVDQIKSIEPDEIVSLGPPPGKGWSKDQVDNPEVTPAQEIPWGISRVNGGVSASDKTAWILDSGILLDHPDLNIDRSLEFSAFTRGRDSGTNDRNGHGTHVAGTIAALDNDFGVIGVAAGARVIPVKVLDGSGSGAWSGILAGVDHVAQYGQAGDVANLSLGGGIYTTLDNAIRAAAENTGIKFVIAAGNSSEDANNSSPARTNGHNVYTISAMDINDRFASFSNYGSPVDYCGPGVDVLSTWKDGGYHAISGTSMAAPHISGLLLLGSHTTDGFVLNDPDGNPDPIMTH